MYCIFVILSTSINMSTELENNAKEIFFNFDFSFYKNN